MAFVPAVAAAIDAAPVAEIATVGSADVEIAAAEAPPDPVAEPEAAFLPKPTAEERAEPATDAPFNPVGAILDALPDQILERFFAEREQARANMKRVAEAATVTEADAVLDGLEADLLAQYRAGRAEAAEMRIAA